MRISANNSSEKLATFLTGDEQSRFVEQVKPTFYVLKKGGNTRQLQAMEKMLELHARNELVPDAKVYGHVKPLAPAPGMAEPLNGFESGAALDTNPNGMTMVNGSPQFPVPS